MSFWRFLLALFMLFRLVSGPIAAMPEDGEHTVTMSFAGDCTIASIHGNVTKGNLNWYAQNYPATYFLEKVEPYFSDDDITVVNCETVLSDRDLQEREKPPGGPRFWFIGPASNANILSSSSVEVACFSNNHMLDYGEEGVTDTIAALEAAGLMVGRDSEPLYVERNGVTVGILACGIWAPGDEELLYDALDEMQRKSDFQVIFPHGGEEGIETPEQWRKVSFRNLIDHGADLIVGTHAHRLQPVERYHGGTIVYCIGNFCFGGNNKPMNRTCIYRCTVTSGPDGVRFEDEIIPCYVYTGSVNNWQPAPIEKSDPNYQKILDFMAGKRSSAA